MCVKMSCEFFRLDTRKFASARSPRASGSTATTATAAPVSSSCKGCIFQTHFHVVLIAGMLLFATLNVFIHRWLWLRTGILAERHQSLLRPNLHAAAMAPWGVAGGAVLLSSMVFGILAAGDSTVGYSGAKLVSQGSLIVSGAWGVLLFRELRSLLQVLFWLLCVQALCGYAVVAAARVVVC